jgi:hypothetical protein
MSGVRPTTLDLCVAEVRSALAARAVASPGALLLSALGTDLVLDLLAEEREIELRSIEGVPQPWRDAHLWTGRIGGLATWVLDDRSAEPAALAAPGWTAGLPVWLASASGASILVHLSAGTSLAPERIRAPGLAVVRDHIHFSGANPLVGLGESGLGPLFPDPTDLHDLELRQAALDHALALELGVAEAIALCTAGPALETAAERRMYGVLGADVVVASLAAPLLAAAHAGLRVLSLVAVTDARVGASELGTMLESALALESPLARLLERLASDLERRAAALSAEGRT